LLFSSDKPLTVRELARAARLDRARTQQLLDELVSESKQRGVVLIEIAGGWTMRSNPSYASYVQKMLALRPVRLSRAQLETLAIIAYRQPVTRPEVDDIRGVDSGQVIKGLLDRDLIKMLGKKDEAGRPMLYGTAPAFLELFSLESLSELPSLKEFTELTQDSREYFESEIGETAPAGNLDDTNLDAPSRTLEDRESDDETLDGSVGLDADGSANLDADGSAPSSGDTPHSDTAAHSDAETTADSDAPPATEWPPTHADDEDDPEIEPANERTSTRRASAEPARDDDDDADDDDEDAKDDEEE
jgi:segregation and condensation protein B